MRQTFFAVLFTVWLHAGAAQAITLGQIDDFQDGTTQGWQEGIALANPPMNLTDGGPTGVGITPCGMSPPGLPCLAEDDSIQPGSMDG